MNKFWMVYRIGGNPPQAQHETEQSANTEAERLARSNPQMQFVVLESKRMVWVSPQPVTVEELVPAEREVPF